MRTTLLLALLAIPAPEPAPINPVGSYVGKWNGLDRYHVHVAEKDGKLISQWIAIDSGELHYVGILQKDGERWRETYAEHEALRCSVPWTWTVAGENPLRFADKDADGWTIHRISKPDF
jgi:hypothetical protein